MKRRILIAHLNTHGCTILREGAKHSVFINSQNNHVSTIPRHPEINDFLAEKICKDLGITGLKK